MKKYVEMNEVLERISRRMENESAIGDYSAGKYNGLKSARRIVEIVPAADVVEVVHGEWVVCGDGENVPWMCSHCGKTTAHKYKVMYGKFCPNCGARMDGE